jgi:hypothetical protein
MGQITPGPLTVMNAFIGYKVYGLVGSHYGNDQYLFAMYYNRYRSSIILLRLQRIYNCEFEL